MTVSKKKTVRKNSKKEQNMKPVVMNSKHVLNKELVKFLDSEAKLVPVERKNKRKKIINWIDELNTYLELSWFTYEQMKEHILTKYKDEKKSFYYSEFYRIIDKWNDDMNLHVTKKEVDQGRFKNMYYKVELV